MFKFDIDAYKHIHYKHRIYNTRLFTYVHTHTHTYTMSFPIIFASCTCEMRAKKPHHQSLKEICQIEDQRGSQNIGVSHLNDPLRPKVILQSESVSLVMLLKLCRISLESPHLLRLRRQWILYCVLPNTSPAGSSPLGIKGSSTTVWHALSHPFPGVPLFAERTALPGTALHGIQNWMLRSMGNTMTTWGPGSLRNLGPHTLRPIPNKNI